MTQTSASSAPIFVLCCSRSGSTLLRYVLDSHPQIGCPPEMHLGPLARQLRWSHALAAGVPVLDGDGASEVEDAGVLARCAASIDAIMAGYLARVGKSRWCDKSVTSVDHAELLRAVFPDARFVCLYRNCMDMVHSGLEVSRQGFVGYGFAEFVARRLDNTVAAIAEYWCDKVGKIAKFEADNPDRCLRLRYEDLVFRPDETVARLLGFVGADADARLPERIFSTPHEDGPGDANILFSRRIERRSVGRGSAIPRRQLPPPLLERVNELLAALDYPPVGPDWDSRPSPYVVDDAVDAPAPRPANAGADPAASAGAALQAMSAMIGAVQEEGVVRFVFEECADAPWHLVLAADAVAVTRDGDGADCDVRMPLASLLAMAQGRANPMALIRSGEMRVSGNVELLRKAFALN